jgi:hypothetical protein
MTFPNIDVSSWDTLYTKCKQTMATFYKVLFQNQENTKLLFPPYER